VPVNLDMAVKRPSLT